MLRPLRYMLELLESKITYKEIWMAKYITDMLSFLLGMPDYTLPYTESMTRVSGQYPIYGKDSGPILRFKSWQIMYPWMPPISQTVQTGDWSDSPCLPCVSAPAAGRILS